MVGVFGAGTVLLEKYRVEAELGRGGMGLVLKVTHLHLGEELALKILAAGPEADPQVHARFLREAQAVVRLRGEHVARVIDVGLLPHGVPYMVMEYLRGMDLAGELARRGALAPGEAVDYVLQACEALAEAHANGIVHRDIKPSNLFVTSRPDGTPLIKVLDFGISKTPLGGQALVTRTDTVMGTPGYMSPEQMKSTREVDARTDIWALGVVLYECLAGRRPFDAELFSAFVLMAATEPPPPMDVRIPRGLQAAVLKCLEKDRNARFPSVAALATALAPFARDQRAAATVVERTSLILRGSQRQPAHTAQAEQAPNATTLSGSVSVRQSSAIRRFSLIALLGAILGGIAIAVVMASTAQTDGAELATTEASAPGPGSSAKSVASESVNTVETLVAVPPPETPVAVPPPPETPVAARPPPETPVAVSAPGAPGAGDAKAQLARCNELATQHEWQALDDCATVLGSLGAKDKAAEFHDKARRETENERNGSRVSRLIREGYLKAAHAAMKQIGEDSVYFKATNDAFLKAENQAVDAAKKTALSYATQRDCVTLRRYVMQLRESSTERVASVAQAQRCTPFQPETTIYLPVDPGTTEAVQSSSPKGPCDAEIVDDLMSQAARQFSHGYAKVALALVVKAFACRQDVKMYRIAVTYACAARDLAAAKLYYVKVPKEFRPALEQRCQQENLDIRSP
jgi:serine/threonine protein kinase